MNDRRNWLNIAFFFLTLLLSLGFGAYLAANRVSDPFLYFDVAFVKSMQQQPQMVIPEVGPYASLVYVPGREILMIQFANMMGIDPQVLQFLPIGIILVSLSLYILCQRLFGSPVVACLTTLYLTFNLSHASALYSVFAYSLALPLFLAFILIGWLFLEKRRPNEIFVLLLLFLGAHVIHYTVTTWMILFLFGANITIWLQKRLLARPVTIRLKPAHYLFFTFFVIFVTFNQAIYKSFLPLIGPETLDSAVQRFLAYMAVDRGDRSPYFYSRSGIVSLPSTVALLIILTPIAIGVVVDIWKMFVRRSEEWLASPYVPLMWGILFMGLVDAASYTIRGSISTKSFSMIFPILTVMYIQRMNRRPMYYGIAVVLFITSVVKIGAFYQQSYVIGESAISSSYQEVDPSARWIQAHAAKTHYTMLADLNLYGKYLVKSVYDYHEPIVEGYTLDQFENVIGVPGGHWNAVPDIVATDIRSSEPIIGFVWLLFEPLHNFTAELRQNQRMHIIYDDGSIWLGKPLQG